MAHDPRDFDDLIAIRDAGTLSLAAKRRGVAISTVSRRIEALEVALGLPLVDRRASGVRLTSQGEALARAAEPLSEQLLRVQRVAERLREGGQRMAVRVSATEAVIADILAPALARLWAAGADFPVHLQSQADIVSLAGRDSDIAIRMVRPEGASLYLRRLGELRLGLFASRDYLAGRDPASLSLAQEKLLLYDDSYGRLPELNWVHTAGIADSIAMRTSSTRALLTAATSGAGIALLPHAFAARHKELVEIPAPGTIPSRQPWLIVHRDLRHLPAVRMTQAWIVACFGELATAGQRRALR